MINKITFIWIVLLLSGCQKQPESLVVVSLGGVHTQSQKVAFYEPFKKQHDMPIISTTYNGEMAKVRAMIETGQVTWDVVQVETPSLIRGCSEGLFESIDLSAVLDTNKVINGRVSECGVGFFSWSIVMAYNSDQLTKAPQSWQDFWNVERFPGKRGLQKSPMFTLEIALLADGVPAKDLYTVLATPEGVDRAFAKLDQLKPHIQWWEKGSQPIPMLISNHVVMTTSFNGRAIIAEEEGRPVRTVWQDSFYDTDNFAIVKGSTQKSIAEQFIGFSLQAKQQKNFAEFSHYGFANQEALGIVDSQVLKNIPNAKDHMRTAHLVDAQFWVTYGELLQKRFDIWAAQ